jgi:hypothetical protein
MAVADARASQVHSAYVTPLRRGGFDDNKDTAADERDDDEKNTKKKRERTSRTGIGRITR